MTHAKTAIKRTPHPEHAARIEAEAARLEHLGMISQPTRRGGGAPRRALIVNGVRYENVTEAAVAVRSSEQNIRAVARGAHTSPKFTACWA